MSVPTEIETVTNREKFTGGCDAETDDELRKRIRDTYINTSNGTNAAYYEQLALTVDGVAKASAIGKARGVGTVNVYVRVRMHHWVRILLQGFSCFWKSRESLMLMLLWQMPSVPPAI